MRILLAMRHAKSSWKDPDLPDHDRPLKGRGRRAARRMGARLRAERLVPDLVLSSSALRARATAEQVAAAGGFLGEIQVVPRLYHASPRIIMACVTPWPDPAALVLLVGHNPGLDELVSQCAGRPVHLKTAHVAVLHPADALDKGRTEPAPAELIRILTPEPDKTVAAS